MLKENFVQRRKFRQVENSVKWEIPVKLILIRSLVLNGKKIGTRVENLKFGRSDNHIPMQQYVMLVHLESSPESQ